MERRELILLGLGAVAIVVSFVSIAVAASALHRGIGGNPAATSSSSSVSGNSNEGSVHRYCASSFKTDPTEYYYPHYILATITFSEAEETVCYNAIAATQYANFSSFVLQGPLKHLRPNTTESEREYSNRNGENIPMLSNVTIGDMYLNGDVKLCGHVSRDVIAQILRLPVAYEVIANLNSIGFIQEMSGGGWFRRLVLGSLC